MAEVGLDEVTKVYSGDIQAVDRLNLRVRDEEFIVLVGSSGCGKSTTLRMVAGLEQVTAGTIRIGGRIVNDVPPKDRDVAMVFQDYTPYPHMTVFQNMAFGLRLRRIDKREIDRRVRTAAAMLNIGELLERKPKDLSGGQRQRMAVGRAIVREPACFLFDEPLSSLDVRLRVETRAQIKRLQHRLKTTTIYVTHDQEEAMTLGNRVGVMDRGVLHQCAPPQEIYDRPVNRFVAEFIGVPPMNFVEGRLVSAGSELVFEGRGIRVRLERFQASAVAKHVETQVVFGIRPESVMLRQADPVGQQDQSLVGKIDFVERLGAMMDVYLNTSLDGQIVARVRAEPLKESSTLTLYLDMTKAHFFAPGAHGDNLTLSGC